MEAAGHLDGAQRNSALAKAVARVQTEHLGVEPGNAIAFYHDRIVVVVMADVLNHAEKHLAQNGNHGDIGAARHLYQTEMEAEFRAAVERLTGRKVIAFLSANNLEPDLAGEIFILDAPL